MTTGYYREFSALEELSIKIGGELRNKPTEAALHLKSGVSGNHELTLIRPRLSSEVSGGFKGFVERLDVQEIDSISVWGEPPEVSSRHGRVHWRVEIWKNDNGMVIIRCAEIKGLPRWDRQIICLCGQFVESGRGSILS